MLLEDILLSAIQYYVFLSFEKACELSCQCLCVCLAGVTMCCTFEEWKTRTRKERCVNRNPLYSVLMNSCCYRLWECYRVILCSIWLYCNWSSAALSRREICLHGDRPEIASLVLLSLLFDVFNIYDNWYLLC